MRIFITGATGFIGKSLVREALNSGHQVIGLTRSEAGAHWLGDVGAEAYHGDITRPATLVEGIARSDGIFHTAFNHDFSTFPTNCAADRQVIEAMGSMLQGSDRPLIITSVAMMGASPAHRLATENYFDATSVNPRIASELAGIDVAARGVRLSVVRLSQVHDTHKQGLITPLIELAKQKGISAYIDDGVKRWAAVHLSDAARLYLLALEQPGDSGCYHAVAEEGIGLREIAEANGCALQIPVKSIPAEEASAHFGWLTPFVSHDMSASSALTRQHLGWQPTGPKLIDDLAALDSALLS